MVCKAFQIIWPFADDQEGLTTVIKERGWYLLKNTTETKNEFERFQRRLFDGYEVATKKLPCWKGKQMNTPSDGF